LFGRRLNVALVGMADGNETFITLQRMAEEAKSFGALASFNRPSLNADSLSQIVSSSVASSLSSKSELTSLKTGNIRAVRTDVKRERQDAKDGKKPTKDWMVFPSQDEEKYVERVWTWNTRTNDFATVIDPRCAECYKDVADSLYDPHKKGSVCDHCRACFFCSSCLKGQAYRQHLNYECADLAYQRRTGRLVARKCPYSYGVAWKRLVFGEGAERLAYKFRFIDKKGKFEGPKMVAKESRFVEDLDEGSKSSYLQSHRHTYHKTFMRTQATASYFAEMFNKSLKEQFSDADTKKLVKIRFLDPVIFELEDISSGTYNVLVEPMIEGKFEKFTDNFGNLKPEAENEVVLPEDSGIDVFSAAKLLGRDAVDLIPKNNIGAEMENLNIIEEGSEEEEDDETSDEEDEGGSDNSTGELCGFSPDNLNPIEYLHAFSHFSYVRSGGRLMVVDLQGSLVQDDGQRTYVLTDPAIHQERDNRRGGLQFKVRRQFGRTDRGREGMKAFFETHECNDICRLFKFRDKKHYLKNKEGN